MFEDHFKFRLYNSNDFHSISDLKRMPRHTVHINILIKQWFTESTSNS